MAEYILKEEVLELLRISCVKKYPASFSFGLFAAASEIYNLPPVDVEEVIRCEKCKNWQKYENTAGAGYCMCKELSFEYGNERKFNPITMPDFCCGYGKEKDGGENRNDA